jgi:AhpD family alkylhydroperoxidase
MVPNLFRVVANSPDALDGYLKLSGALSTGILDNKVREQIALAVAEINKCDYCLSAHTTLGGLVGLSDDDILKARRSSSSDLRTDAILKLARAIVIQRGEISNTDFESARAASLSDAEMVEIVLNVTVNILTNYINHVAQTVIDFPEVRAGVDGSDFSFCNSETCGCGGA